MAQGVMVTTSGLIEAVSLEEALGVARLEQFTEYHWKQNKAARVHLLNVNEISEGTEERV